ncbi:MAG: hypothetical protein ABID54_06810 [Pseudomonadota bacterium]
MIKNTLIALLSLAVIALSWITLSGTPDKQALLSQFKDKIDATRGQISEVYKTANQKAELGAENTSVNDPLGSEEKGIKSVTINEIRSKGIPNDTATKHVKQQAEESAVTILSNIKQQRKDKPDLLTGDELSSILSILKSAQDLLRKTAGATPDPPPKDVTSGDVSPQTTVVKKKLSAGLVESELIPTSR